MNSTVPRENKRTAAAALLCLAMLLCAGCRGVAPSAAEDVTPQRMQELVRQHDAVILDVRDPAEFQALPPAPGALNIPLGQLESKLDSLDRDKHFVLACRTGNRSAQAARIMRNKGFTNLYNLEGGMQNYWKQMAQ